MRDLLDRTEEDVSVEVLRGRGGFDSLVGRWDALVEQIASPRYFQLSEWYAAYLDALEPDDDRVLFLACERGGRTVAIIPLRQCFKRVGGVPARVLELPYHEHMPLADIVAESSDSARLAFERVLRWLGSAEAPAWDLLAFTHVLDDSLAAYVTSVGRASTVTRRLGHSDLIDVDRSYDALLSSFSKNFRGNLRKARNKLEQASPVFESLDVTPLDDALGTFFAVEASGWKGASGKGTAIGLHAELRRFYESLAARTAKSGRLEINALRVDGTPVASQFCLRVGERCHVLKIGYDEKYAQLAPGNMLLEHRLRAACADAGLREVDLVSDAAWHVAWNPRREGVREIYLARSLRGRLTLAALATTQAIRARLRPLVKWLRSWRKERAKHSEPTAD